MKVLLALLIVCSVVDSYKILVYSNLFGHSHVKFVGAAADTLTDAGHNVVCLESCTSTYFSYVSDSPHACFRPSTSLPNLSEIHQKHHFHRASRECFGSDGADEGVPGESVDC